MKNNTFTLLDLLETKLSGNEEAVEMFRHLRESVEELAKQLDNQKIRTIQAQQLASLAEMATGVSHELNQPLNAILMTAQMIRMWLKKGKEISSDRLDNMMVDVERCVRRGSKIITQMRQFGSGSRHNIMPIDINRPVVEVFDLMRQQLKSEDIEVVFELADDLPAIKSDDYQIQQIFFHFITNARDALRERAQSAPKDSYQKKLVVRTGLDDREFVFTSIEDNGTGIPQENIQKIFEPFFTTKEVGKGEGLGLAIIYGLVNEHKGTIEVESELNVGSKFTLKFPPA